MAIDPSIFAQANKPTVALADPQEQMRNMLGVQAQSNANKLYEAQRLAGAAAQAATDPVTGQVDQNKLNRGVASDPSIAPAAMQALQQGNTIGGGQTDNQIKRRAAVQQSAVGLLTMSDAQLEGGQALHSQFDSELQSGLMDQATHDAALRAAPPLGSNAGQIRQYLKQIAVGGMGSTEALNAAVGTRATMNNGQADIPGITGGIVAPNGQDGAFRRTGSPTEIFPSRATGLQQNRGVDSQGRETQQTLADRAKAEGQGAQMGPAFNDPSSGSGKYPGLPPGLLPPGYNGRFPGGGAAPGKAPGQAASPAAPAASPGGTVVTGLAPGQAEAAVATAAASAGQGINLQKAADSSNDRHAMLANMETDLGNFTSGPGADKQKQISSFMARNLGAVGRTFALSNEQSIASQESFEKLGKQIALQQSGALGSTDAKLETSLGANPNTGLSQLGNKQIIAMLHGNEDAITAKNQAWQQYQGTHGAGSYGTFSTEFNKNFDPRAYQLLRMDPADARKMVGDMQPAQRAAFRTKYDAMSAAGLIDAPARAAPAPAPAPAQLQPAPATPTPPEPLSRRANRLLP